MSCCRRQVRCRQRSTTPTGYVQTVQVMARAYIPVSVPVNVPINMLSGSGQQARIITGNQTLYNTQLYGYPVEQNSTGQQNRALTGNETLFSTQLYGYPVNQNTTN